MTLTTEERAELRALFENNAFSLGRRREVSVRDLLDALDAAEAALAAERALRERSEKKADTYHNDWVQAKHEYGENMRRLQSELAAERARSAALADRLWIEGYSLIQTTWTPHNVTTVRQCRHCNVGIGQDHVKGCVTGAVLDAYRAAQPNASATDSSPGLNHPPA